MAARVHALLLEDLTVSATHPEADVGLLLGLSTALVQLVPFYPTSAALVEAGIAEDFDAAAGILSSLAAAAASRPLQSALCDMPVHPERLRSTLTVFGSLLTPDAGAFAVPPDGSKPANGPVSAFKSRPAIGSVGRRRGRMGRAFKARRTTSWSSGSSARRLDGPVGHASTSSGQTKAFDTLAAGTAPPVLVTGQGKAAAGPVLGTTVATLSAAVSLAAIAKSTLSKRRGLAHASRSTVRQDIEKGSQEGEAAAISLDTMQQLLRQARNMMSGARDKGALGPKRVTRRASASQVTGVQGKGKKAESAESQTLAALQAGCGAWASAFAAAAAAVEVVGALMCSLDCKAATRQAGERLLALMTSECDSCADDPYFCRLATLCRPAAPQTSSQVASSPQAAAMQAAVYAACRRWMQQLLATLVDAALLSYRVYAPVAAALVARFDSPPGNDPHRLSPCVRDIPAALAQLAEGLRTIPSKRQPLRTDCRQRLLGLAARLGRRGIGSDVASVVRLFQQGSGKGTGDEGGHGDVVLHHAASAAAVAIFTHAASAEVPLHSHLLSRLLPALALSMTGSGEGEGGSADDMAPPSKAHRPLWELLTGMRFGEGGVWGQAALGSMLALAKCTPPLSIRTASVYLPVEIDATARPSLEALCAGESASSAVVAAIERQGAPRPADAASCRTTQRLRGTLSAALPAAGSAIDSLSPPHVLYISAVLHLECLRAAASGSASHAFTYLHNPALAPLSASDTPHAESAGERAFAASELAAGGGAIGPDASKAATLGHLRSCLAAAADAALTVALRAAHSGKIDAKGPAVDMAQFLIASAGHRQSTVRKQASQALSRVTTAVPQLLWNQRVLETLMNATEALAARAVQGMQPLPPAASRAAPPSAATTVHDMSSGVAVSAGPGAGDGVLASPTAFVGQGQRLAIPGAALQGQAAQSSPAGLEEVGPLVLPGCRHHLECPTSGQALAVVAVEVAELTAQWLAAAIGHGSGPRVVDLLSSQLARFSGIMTAVSSLHSPHPSSAGAGSPASAHTLAYPPPGGLLTALAVAAPTAAASGQALVCPPTGTSGLPATSGVAAAAQAVVAALGGAAGAQGDDSLGAAATSSAWSTALVAAVRSDALALPGAHRPTQLPTGGTVTRPALAALSALLAPSAPPDSTHPLAMVPGLLPLGSGPPTDFSSPSGGAPTVSLLAGGSGAETLAQLQRRSYFLGLVQGMADHHERLRAKAVRSSAKQFAARLAAGASHAHADSPNLGPAHLAIEEELVAQGDALLTTAARRWAAESAGLALRAALEASEAGSDPAAAPQPRELARLVSSRWARRVRAAASKRPSAAPPSDDSASRDADAHEAAEIEREGVADSSPGPAAVLRLLPAVVRLAVAGWRYAARARQRMAKNFDGLVTKQVNMCAAYLVWHHLAWQAEHPDAKGDQGPQTDATAAAAALAPPSAASTAFGVAGRLAGASGTSPSALDSAEAYQPPPVIIVYLVWLPVRAHSSGVMEAAVAAWEWLLAAVPQARKQWQFALSVDPATGEAQSGAAASGGHPGPELYAPLPQGLAGGRFSEAAAHQHNSGVASTPLPADMVSVEPHRVWLGFWARVWGTALAGGHVGQSTLIAQAVSAALASPQRLCTHPAALGTRLRLVHLALTVLQAMHHPRYATAAPKLRTAPGLAGLTAGLADAHSQVADADISLVAADRDLAHGVSGGWWEPNGDLGISSGIARGDSGVAPPAHGGAGRVAPLSLRSVGVPSQSGEASSTLLPPSLTFSVPTTQDARAAALSRSLSGARGSASMPRLGGVAAWNGPLAGVDAALAAYGARHIEEAREGGASPRRRAAPRFAFALHDTTPGADGELGNAPSVPPPSAYGSAATAADADAESAQPSWTSLGVGSLGLFRSRILAAVLEWFKSPPSWYEAVTSQHRLRADWPYLVSTMQLLSADRAFWYSSAVPNRRTVEAAAPAAAAAGLAAAGLRDDAVALMTGRPTGTSGGGTVGSGPGSRNYPSMTGALSKWGSQTATGSPTHCTEPTPSLLPLLRPHSSLRLPSQPPSEGTTSPSPWVTAARHAFPSTSSIGSEALGGEHVSIIAATRRGSGLGDLGLGQAPGVSLGHQLQGGMRSSYAGLGQSTAEAGSVLSDGAASGDGFAFTGVDDTGAGAAVGPDALTSLALGLAASANAAPDGREYTTLYAAAQLAYTRHLSVTCQTLQAGGRAAAGSGLPVEEGAGGMSTSTAKRSSSLLKHCRALLEAHPIADLAHTRLRAPSGGVSVASGDSAETGSVVLTGAWGVRAGLSRQAPSSLPPDALARDAQYQGQEGGGLGSIPDASSSEAFPGQTALSAVAGQVAVALLLLANEADRQAAWHNPLSLPARRLPNESMVSLHVYARVPGQPSTPFGVMGGAVKHATYIGGGADAAQSVVQASPTSVLSCPAAVQYLVTWETVEQCAPCLSWLSSWAVAAPPLALRLLSRVAPEGSLQRPLASHPAVMAYVVRSLRHQAPSTIVFYLPQLVQALRHDGGGLLADFLLGVSQVSMLVAHQLMWSLSTESKQEEGGEGDATHGFMGELPGQDTLPQRASALFERVQASFPPLAEAMFRTQYDFWDAITDISGRLKREVPSKSDRSAKIKSFISQLSARARADVHEYVAKLADTAKRSPPTAGAVPERFVRLRGDAKLAGAAGTLHVGVSDILSREYAARRTLQAADAVSGASSEAAVDEAPALDGAPGSPAPPVSDLGAAAVPSGRAQDIVRSELAAVLRDSVLYLPTNPDFRLITVREDSGRAMQSAAKCPFMLSFNVTPFHGPDAAFQKQLQALEEPPSSSSSEPMPGSTSSPRRGGKPGVWSRAKQQLVQRYRRLRGRRRVSLPSESAEEPTEDSDEEVIMFLAQEEGEEQDDMVLVVPEDFSEQVGDGIVIPASHTPAKKAGLRWNLQRIKRTSDHTRAVLAVKSAELSSSFARNKLSLQRALRRGAADVASRVRSVMGGASGEAAAQAGPAEGESFLHMPSPTIDAEEAAALEGETMEGGVDLSALEDAREESEETRPDDVDDFDLSSLSSFSASVASADEEAREAQHTLEPEQKAEAPSASVSSADGVNSVSSGAAASGEPGGPSSAPTKTSDSGRSIKQRVAAALSSARKSTKRIRIKRFRLRRRRKAPPAPQAPTRGALQHPSLPGTARAMATRSKAIIFKVYDDIRQDALALQLIGMLKASFDTTATGLTTFPYRVVPSRVGSGKDAGGLLEVVPNARSMDDIGKSGNPSLYHYFVNKFGRPGTPAFDAAQRNFARSSASYAVACMLLWIKDRHNGNILVNGDGHLIHIDFGFLLGISPGGNLGWETAAFKWTQEMMDILGGEGSEPYQYFMQLTARAMLLAHQLAEPLSTLIGGMADSGLDCFKFDYTLQFLRQRQRWSDTPLEVVDFMLDRIRDAANNPSTWSYDGIQKAQNNIHSQTWQ
ncbi:PI4KA [Symbiodinium sp. KB8]|nr:PI4KA [Symbiodinium sp. KB8]